jgi:hypothetical protein
MQTSFIEKYPQNKRSKVSIKPFFEADKANMGLEKYGLSLFDGTAQEEPIACVEQYGIVRFITGLDEFAPEVKLLPVEEREAKVKQIRVVVAQLEKDLLANVILDIDGPDFWNQVKLLRPNNMDFWDKIKIRVGNEAVYLEPERDPYDLIKLYAIEAGGFSLVAGSLEDARARNIAPKFYLDKLEETASTLTEIKKLRNKALGALESMFNKNQNKLFYVAKVIDTNSAQYKKSTPNDIIYDQMDRFINGESFERDKRKAAERFIQVSDFSMEALKIRAIVKDAAYFSIYATKSDGFIYDVERNMMLGKTQADCIEFLKNPLNEEALADITKKLERYWNA